jgi:AraC-like DNA-binding protein
MKMKPIEFKELPLIMNNRRTNLQPFEGYYHSHQAGELLYVHRGKGRVVVNQRTYDIRPGMLFYFQPFQLHRVHADISLDSPYERTVIHYLPSMMERYLHAFPGLHQFFLHIGDDQLPEYAYDLAPQMTYMAAHCDYYSKFIRQGQSQVTDLEEHMALFFSQLMQLFRACYVQQVKEPSTAYPRSRRYSELIMQWLELHYKEDFHLEELAEALHLSKFYVSRVFRTETGSSITDYIVARRMKEACLLLHTTLLSIERIGLEIGMRNTSYFSQLFKKMIGISPKEYRKRGLVIDLLG